jgi:hypothetical protein
MHEIHSHLGRSRQNIIIAECAKYSKDLKTAITSDLSEYPGPMQCQLLLPLFVIAVASASEQMKTMTILCSPYFVRVSHNAEESRFIFSVGLY